jgi:hypothetical protein
VAPSESAEWYLLISGGQTITARLAAGGGAISFTPVPFGHDVFAQFGDEFGLPVPGNFDPPITSAPMLGNTNVSEVRDVNNDGFVTPQDALLIINRLNASGAGVLGSTAYPRAPFVDVDGDGNCSPIDALLVINWLNSHSAGSPSSGGEGEPVDAYYEQLDGSASDDDSLAALLAAEDYDRRRK